MRNIFVISVFVAIFAISASAQNLDPTVEVSRQYEGKLVEVHKPLFDMAVPDSVTRFALEYDYSVFDNPYKGSYEFNPYLLSMKPSASDSGENRFYLRAGVGYQLHPTLDLVWSPKFKRKGFNMDLYAIHRSFVGNYLTISPEETGLGEIVMTKVPKAEDGSHKWYGYDIMNKGGVVFKHDWETLALEYSAGYYGLAQKDRDWLRGYNAFDASFGLQTKPENTESLVFDLNIDFRYGEEKVKTSEFVENLLDVDLKVGPILRKNRRFCLDFESDLASYGFVLGGGVLSVKPGYMFRKNGFAADLGLSISKMLTNAGVKDQYVYPNINISFALLPNSLKFYMRATGGAEFETYSSLISENHHITHLMSPLNLGYKLERAALTAGFDGRITDDFSYNLRGGYVDYASLRHYSVTIAGEPSFNIAYMACQKWYSAFDWSLDVEGVRFNGSLQYDNYWDDSNNDEQLSGNMSILKPAALTGKAAVEYTWKKRLVCGIETDFSGAMKGYDISEHRKSSSRSAPSRCTFSLKICKKRSSLVISMLMQFAPETMR